MDLLVLFLILLALGALSTDSATLGDEVVIAALWVVWTDHLVVGADTVFLVAATRAFALAFLWAVVLRSIGSRHSEGVSWIVWKCMT